MSEDSDGRTIQTQPPSVDANAPSKMGGGWNSQLKFISATGLTADQIADIEAHIEGLTPGPDTYPMPPHGWTCFHCGQTFKTLNGARLHFGSTPGQSIACQVPEDDGGGPPAWQDDAESGMEP